MAYTNGNMIKSVDWLTIAFYLILVVLGWFSICGASYDYTNMDFFSFDTRSGKQLIWIGCSIGLGFVLLMLEEKLFDLLAYVFYGLMMLLLFITPLIAEDTKGSYSWLKFGPVSLQPAEFAKFITALALAKFMNVYGYTMNQLKYSLPTIFLILLPMILIVLQKETGSALVYLSFFLMLYREGMSGAVLFTGISAIVFFVVGIRFGQELMPDECTPVGEFVVFSLVTILSALLVNVYCDKKNIARNILLYGSGSIVLAFLFSMYVIPFNVIAFMYMECLALIGYLLYSFYHDRLKNCLYIALFAVGSIAFLYSVDYMFNKLDDHQRVRIEVVLGMKEDLAGAGYNVNQSKIAIGSGGLTGKGFLNGTQTKLKYVPEQDTDFIFCTVGEEQGFVGSAVVLLLYTALILRLLILAERQNTRFGRVYGYCVLSIFFFHLFINIGMVLGLTPVIGIPLPFFSYGGSSLWGFTILLFLFLRIDSFRSKR